jgi:tetraacyldisaccharide 4'-kinase
VRLGQAWLRRGLLAYVLRPLSWLYALAWQVRSVLYRWGLFKSQRLPVPVVVVGNVVVSGSGKTPTTIALVQHLQARGWHPGVVSRGHGRQGPSVLEVTPHTPSLQSGDEPALIARQTGVPVFVGQRRVDAAHALLAKHPTVNIVVSDDGMQHWAMQRDITLVVFDERGTGNGWLLPAGLLREPWPAQPWGAGHMLVLQYGDSPQAIATAAVRSVIPIVFKGHKLLAPYALDAAGARHVWPQALGGSAVVGAIAGIAQPQRFFGMLHAHGIGLQTALTLPDHAPEATLHQALLAAQRLHPRITHWLCTEKDAVKLWEAPQGANQPLVWAVPLAAQLPAELWSTLDATLDHVLSSTPQLTRQLP